MRDEPYTVDIDVRFNDVDLLGHVNNAVFASYLESARFEYYPAVLGSFDSYESVLAHLEIDFERPIELDDDVTVALWATEVGNSTLHVSYEVRASGEVAATAETVELMYDPETGESRPVPEDWRRRVEEFEGL
jgi:acyl-CoA thioester hydrolase